MADALEQLRNQARQARADVQDWRRQQLNKLNADAERIRREATESASDVEKEAQEQIEVYRRAGKGAGRSAEIGIKKSSKPYTEAAKEIEAERAGIIKKVITSKEKLSEAKKQAEAEIK